MLRSVSDALPGVRGRAKLVVSGENYLGMGSAFSNTNRGNHLRYLAVRSYKTRCGEWEPRARSQGLSAQGLVWSVGVPRRQKVFTTNVGLLFPRASRGKPRLHPVPSENASDAEDVLAGCRWPSTARRQGSKGELAARLAAVRVRVADGPRSPRHGHLPGEEVWLVGEWRSSGERKYYLSNLPPGTSLHDHRAPETDPP